MRALITGGNGFVGRHLAAHLLKCGDDVAVTYKPGAEGDEYLGSIPLPKQAQTFALDVTDKSAVKQFVSVVKPDVVYHLAAMTFVPDAEKDFSNAMQVNFSGTVNLLDAIYNHSKTTKFLYVGSAEVYGEPWPGSLPLTEQATLRPVNSYGVSKCAADLSVFKYGKSNGLYVVRVRPFPHLGPGQRDSFAISSFAKQLAEIKLGKKEPVLKVGNLEAKRDYSDVSDIVRGYREAMLNGVSPEAYNLCSGQSYQIGELLQELIKISGLSVEVTPDESRMRQIDIPELYGSYQKAQKDFGWKPRIDIKGTLSSVFAHWVETLSKA